jgi:NADH:ubiquinone oxidoreductase subunit 6 (subunit J)
MSDPGTIIAFWVFAILAVGSALAIVGARSLVHAVLALILSFVGVAGLFITLSADFVAVAQLLIYAGAIGVLTIFAIMLTPRSARENGNSDLFWPGMLLGLLIFGVIGYVALTTAWPAALHAGFGTTAADIGAAILSQYALPFEVVSIVLLAALIGALVIVRGEDMRAAGRSHDA